MMGTPKPRKGRESPGISREYGKDGGKAAVRGVQAPSGVYVVVMMMLIITTIMSTYCVLNSALSTLHA